jgi:predicted acylesterase/phospholipase RssA
LRTLSTRVDIARVGGASAGAIAAAAEAFAIPEREQRDLLLKVLQKDHLKDRAFWPLDRFGLHNGDNLLTALKSVFGTRKMGDALIPLRIMVCDLWTRQPVVIDSANPDHAKLLVVDVLRCSAAIPVFFKAWKLPQWRGNRLFVDGGTAANFALGMFDDSDRRTIGLRLCSSNTDDVKPVKDLASFGEAIANIVLWASDNAYISKKRFADVIAIPTDGLGSGLDFNLSVEMIEKRWATGSETVFNTVL